MLVQYALPGRIGQVVPDNMIVVSDEPARAVGSYNIPFEKTGLLLVFEYVSSSSIRKDYKDSFRKYEKDLKVPYCLLFYPERQDLRVYHHENRRYRRLPPNDAGRYSIPELELEVGLQDGWVRFWYQGQLLELPAELQQNVEAANLRAAQQERRADQEKRRADQEKRCADQEKRAPTRKRKGGKQRNEKRPSCALCWKSFAASSKDGSRPPRERRRTGFTMQTRGRSWKGRRDGVCLPIPAPLAAKSAIARKARLTTKGRYCC